MKKFLFIPLLFLLLPLGASAATIFKAPNNLGLVGYWSFNEGTSTVARDFSGKGNTGTLSGTNKPSWTAGKLGSALNFTGSSSYVSLGTTGIPGGNSNYTMSAWVKASAMGTYGILGWGQWSSGNAVNALRFNSNGVYNYWWSNDLLCSNGALGNNQWHHILAKFDGTTRSIYIDGTFCNSDTPGSSHNAVVTDVNIGRTNTSEYFPGSIDEVRIYNRALSAAEVSALYRQGAVAVGQSNAAALSSGLVGYWTFDGSKTNWGTGTTQDSSGNGNTAQLLGFSTTTSVALGKVGQGLKFNGTTSYIAGSSGASAAANVGLGSISAGAWVKSSVANNMEVLDYKQDGAATHAGWKLAFRPSDGNSLLLLSGDGVTQVQSSYSLSAVNNGAWHHVMLVIDRNTNFQYLYVDGQLRDSDSIAALGSLAVSQTFAVGAAPSGGGSSFFNGWIDDVRLYNRALSAAEVAQLYKLGGGTVGQSNTKSVSGDLAAYWTLDGPKVDWSTGKAQDSSGNSNTAQLTNLSTSTSVALGKVGQAIFFPGTPSKTYLSSTLSGTFTTFTISYWQYMDAISTDGNSIQMRFGGTSFYSYANGLYRVVDNPFGCQSPNANGTVGSVSTSDYLKKWRLLTYTLQGTTMSIYRDGVLQVTCSTAGSTNTSTSPPLLIGNIYPNRDFIGKLDDVRIYSRALTASEVQQLYNTTK